MTSLSQMVPQDLNYQHPHFDMMAKPYPFFYDQRMKPVLDPQTQYMDLFGADPQPQMQDMKQEYCRLDILYILIFQTFY